MNVMRERDARSQLSSMSLRLQALRYVQASRQRRELPSLSNVAMLEISVSSGKSGNWPRRSSKMRPIRMVPAMRMLFLMLITL